MYPTFFLHTNVANKIHKTIFKNFSVCPQFHILMGYGQTWVKLNYPLKVQNKIIFLKY